MEVDDEEVDGWVVSVAAVEKDVILSTDNELDDAELDKELLVEVVPAFDDEELLERLADVLVDDTALLWDDVVLGTVIAGDEEELIELVEAILGVNIMELEEIETVLTLDDEMLLDDDAKLVDNDGDDDDDKMLFDEVTAIPNVNELEVEEAVTGNPAEVELLVLSGKELVLGELAEEEDIRKV